MPELDLVDGQFVYEPDGRVLGEFVGDRSDVAVICGPIGSGTSTGCCFRIWQTACEQKPSRRDGRRHVRVGVIRTTYPELNTSTLKTWLTWFPEETYGRLIRSRPMNQVIQIGDLDLDMWFLALDDESDVKKLMSTEFTMIWFNELEFHNYRMFMEAHSRVVQGRYPPVMDGGPTWHGLIADMNAPPEDHFLARMANASGLPGWGGADYPDDTLEEERIKWPKDWFLRKQPPGLIEVFGPDGSVTGYVENPEAENRKWQTKGYLEVIKGKTKRWIDSRVMNRLTFLQEGDPVWGGFREDRHLAKGPLPYVRDREVGVAIDFGRTRPCALICQEIGDRLQVQREFRMYGVSATVFAPALKRFLTKEYPGATIRFTGDPKGRDRGQANEATSYDVFESFGMKVIPAPVRNNDIAARLEPVNYALETSWLLISPECRTLVAALSGKYVWDKSDAEKPVPLKRGAGAKYSDVADCLQYECLFRGEGRRMVGLTAANSPKPAKVAKFRSLRRVAA